MTVASYLFKSWMIQKHFESFFFQMKLVKKMKAVTMNLEVMKKPHLHVVIRYRNQAKVMKIHLKVKLHHRSMKWNHK